MLTESRREWVKVVACATAAAVYVAALIVLAAWLPGCDGVRTITVGGSMLLAGCPELLP